MKVYQCNIQYRFSNRKYKQLPADKDDSFPIKMQIHTFTQTHRQKGTIVVFHNVYEQRKSDTRIYSVMLIFQTDIIDISQLSEMWN